MNQFREVRQAIRHLGRDQCYSIQGGVSIVNNQMFRYFRIVRRNKQLTPVSEKRYRVNNWRKRLAVFCSQS